MDPVSSSNLYLASLNSHIPLIILLVQQIQPALYQSQVLGVQIQALGAQIQPPQNCGLLVGWIDTNKVNLIGCIETASLGAQRQVWEKKIQAQCALDTCHWVLQRQAWVKQIQPCFCSRYRLLHLTLRGLSFGKPEMRYRLVIQSRPRYSLTGFELKQIQVCNLRKGQIQPHLL